MSDLLKTNYRPWLKTGHRVCYVQKNFRQDSLDTIEAMNVIIHEYESRGHSMSLRQVYYQMVARGMIENTEGSYNRIKGLLSDGRLAGLISWTAIVDRGRGLLGHQTFRTPDHAVRWLIEDHYRIDMWQEQRYRPEVWVEKAAQEGTIWDVCSRLRVDCFACKGYNSSSEQWSAGRRFAGYVAKGQTPVVFHLGDHDPSGIDMTRDNRDRLSMFAGGPVLVVRLALNKNQIEKYGPPPNPAKFDDPRAEDYVREHGYSSWELDALEPDVIKALIEEAVLEVRDQKKWDQAMLLEAEHKMTLESMVEDRDASEEE